MKNKPLEIGNTVVQPGERITVGLPTPELSTYTSMHIPVHIIHGKQEGPCLVVTAGINGDEMNGIAILQKILDLNILRSLRGTLIAVPMLNVYGLMTLTRRLPDRRDLDGSFPGNPQGTYADRLAAFFTNTILAQATHCIDIHSGEPHLCSEPHLQSNFNLSQTTELATAFQPSLMVHTTAERGLLLLNKQEIPTVIYETGEPMRLDDRGIRLGFRGIMNVMRGLGMLKLSPKAHREQKPLLVHLEEDLRAPGSGLCKLLKSLGSKVAKGDLVAEIYDPFGTARKFEITSPIEGVVLARNTLPLVNEGDPLYHIGSIGPENV